MEDQELDSPSKVENEEMSIDPTEMEASGDAEIKDEVVKEDDPYRVKKRLGMQAKRHQREMRELRSELAEMQSQMGHGKPEPSLHEANPYTSPGQPSMPQGAEEERIHKAVRYALQARDAEAQKVKDADHQAHVQRQYERLNQEFDKGSEKYEDFDDIVRGDDVPFSRAIRDALLLVDNPAEVAYRLGKDKSKLKKITELYPLDQAREVAKLSFALMNGGGAGNAASSKVNPLNPLKANPVTSNRAVTEKTSVDEIRQRMKSGTWR